MNFCMRLAKKVVLNELKTGQNKNVLTSPLSLNMALNMVAAGSHGRTLEQLLGSLESKSISELNQKSSQMMALAIPVGGPLLSIVNGVWVDRRFSVKPSYQEIAKNIYKADARAVDFVNKPDEVVEEVNSWVKDETKGLIKDILSRGHVRNDLMLILANALYFKGAWKNAFEISRTRDEDFHLLNGETIKVPFMTTKKNKAHLYGSFDGFKLLKLPYRCGDHEDKIKFSMYVILPDERNGLENLIQKLCSDPFLLNQQCEGLREVNLSDMWLPKFKFSYDFKPSETMKELGLNLLFMSVGELTEMVDSNNVSVTDIIQKCFVEVNEEGTEAAAVTKMILGRPRYYKPPPPPSFIADHPFLFMIKEEVSGDVIFTGAVLNPLLAD